MKRLQHRVKIQVLTKRKKKPKNTFQGYLYPGHYVHHTSVTAAKVSMTGNERASISSFKMKDYCFPKQNLEKVLVLLDVVTAKDTDNNLKYVICAKQQYCLRSLTDTFVQVTHVTQVCMDWGQALFLI